MLGALGSLLGLGEDAAVAAATPTAAGNVEASTQVVAPAGSVDPQQPVIAATSNGGSTIVNAGVVPPATPVVAPAGSVNEQQPVVIHNATTSIAKYAPLALVGVIGWWFFIGRKK